MDIEIQNKESELTFGDLEAGDWFILGRDSTTVYCKRFFEVGEIRYNLLGFEDTNEISFLIFDGDDAEVTRVIPRKLVIELTD